MASVNKVILVGHLGENPELKAVGDSSVCNFSIATSESWTGKDGSKQEKTEWHRIVVWGKVAENCAKYLSKGKQVYVEGKLQTRSWDDKEGVKRYATDIVARDVTFLGSANDGVKNNKSNEKKSEAPGGATSGDFDVPF